MKLRLQILFKFLAIFFWMMNFSFKGQAVIYYTINDGYWTQNGVWAYSPTGSTCNCYPSGSDSIVISHVVAMNKHLKNAGGALGEIKRLFKIEQNGQLTGFNSYDIEVGPAGYLFNCGKLTMRNLTFQNNSIVYVCSGANMSVNGNFLNMNNSDNIRIDGSMSIMGSYTNGNGGVVLGSGSISIFSGPVTNTGNTMGCTGTNPCSSLPCMITSPCGGIVALPVHFSAFSGKVDKEKVTLSWTTETEINNEYFEIEHATSDTSFQPILKIQGKGTSTNRNTYTAFHSKPDRGLNLYRIKQVDYDGHYSFSEVIAVEFTGDKNFFLYPNPLDGKNLRLYLNENSEAIDEVSVCDLQGRNLMALRNTDGKFTGTEINLSDYFELPPGFYLFILKSKTQNFSQRLVIQ